MPVVHAAPTAPRMRGAVLVGWVLLLAVLVLGVVWYVQYSARASPLLDAVAGS